MIDGNLLLNDFDTSAQRLARKGVARAELEQLRERLTSRKSMVGQLGDKRAELNTSSKAIGQLMKQGKKDEAEAQRSAVGPLKQQIETLEQDLKQTEEAIHEQLLLTPNFPADECPDGKGDDDNVVLRTEGYDESLWKDRNIPAHWDIAEPLGILDTERAAKISGQMFSLLRGDGARLLQALVSYAVDLNRHNYEFIIPPHFVRTDTFTATGHLPKFAEEAYKMRDDDLWAIPTGEVPLMSLHRDEILDEAELPKHYMAYTVCFRREAGAAGSQTRGMQRLHEFHKVELVKLCTPETVQEAFEGLVADAERPLKQLGLPYRILDLCAGDLTFSSTRVYDLEVYAPGIDRWLEVSSCGIFTDFQTRRGNIRFRRGKDKPRFCYALNGSGLATPRVWAAIIEHGYQPDGTVKIPPPLVPYMGGQEVIEAKG